MKRLNVLFYFPSCTDCQRKLLKVPFKPKYASCVKSFFQPPLCLFYPLYRVHIWLISRGMMSALYKILLVHMWFFSSKMSQTKVNRSYPIAEKKKAIISATALAVRTLLDHSNWMQADRASSLDRLTVSFIQPAQVVLPSKSTLSASLTEISVSMCFVSVLITTPYLKFLDIIKIFYGTIQLH